MILLVSSLGFLHSTMAQEQTSTRIDFLHNDVKVHRSPIVEKKISIILNNKSYSRFTLVIKKNREIASYINLGLQETKTINIEAGKKDLLEVYSYAPALEVINISHGYVP